MKFGVLVFPGSNCDHDTYNVIAEIAHQPVTFLWHDSEDLQGVDAVLVPGGFAYGDYLRPGAIARFSPGHAGRQAVCGAGGLVLGICNGFQILTESGLLPGALMRNAGLEVHLQTGASARGNNQQPIYEQLDEGRGSADSHRSHGRQLFLHARGSAAARSARTASPSAMQRRKARSRRRQIPMARWAISPES